MKVPTISQQDVLDGVVHLFWEKGYEGCSMEELVQATGASRYRFYEHFGSKRALFLAALDFYYSYYFQPPLSILMNDEAGLDELKAFFARRTLSACSDQGRHGCLIFNSMADPGAYDLDIALQLRGYRDPVIQCLTQAVRRAQQRRQMRVDMPAETIAAQLYTLLHSMMGLCRLKDHETLIEQAVQSSFKALERSERAVLADEIKRQLSALDRKRVPA